MILYIDNNDILAKNYRYLVCPEEHKFKLYLSSNDNILYKLHQSAYVFSEINNIWNNNISYEKIPDDFGSELYIKYFPERKLFFNIENISEDDIFYYMLKYDMKVYKND